MTIILQVLLPSPPPVFPPPHTTTTAVTVLVIVILVGVEPRLRYYVTQGSVGHAKISFWASLVLA